MLVALLSDVQSNAAALRAVLEAIDERQPDYVFALGDFVGRGPEPKDVLKILERRAIARTRGTWDARVAGLEETKEGEGEQTRWVKAARRMLRPRQVEELASPPDTRQLLLGGRSFSIAQRAIPEVETALKPETGHAEVLRALRSVEAEVIAVGGTPAFVRRVDGHLLVSSGSVGQPMAGDPRASFVLVDVAPDREPTAEIVRVPYSLRKNVRAMRRAEKKKLVTGRMVNEYFAALLEGAGRDAPTRLEPTDSGSALTVKLLAHRAHRVFAAAAGEWPADSMELVHDLRVATRRLREALAIARPLLPKRLADRIDRRAQKLGRVLGERRIADVISEHHKKHDVTYGERIPSFGVMLEARRAHAAERFDASYPGSKLLRHGVAVLALAMEAKRSPQSLADIAPTHIERRADRVEKLMALIDDPEAKRDHHRLRIALKHLRYSAEIIGEAFPTLIPEEETVRPMRKLQDALGDLNDAEELLLLARRHQQRKGKDEEALPEYIAHLEGQARAHYNEVKALIPALVPHVLEQMRSAAAQIRASASR
jgi:protein phosphatase